MSDLKNLIAFAKWAIRESAFDGCDLGGGEVQQKATALGLLVEVPYDPEKHGRDNGYRCDAGDPWFEFAGPLKGAAE